ncbi:hypothetical protein psyc5s11_21050 [Clostridium gelidum]|uniref:Antitoxin n=1 Tax=Clostridium gelidum TaxID=704125 RepID=A0ABN6IX83_9CLOT|nr:hypothetical protein [Clostridium gelidum]BCZ46038.1 hypothetical protein psyc5s11_21050 [Clostridium gelidum]
MINRDRVLKLLGDFKEWESDFKECIDSLEKCDNDIKKLLYHSVRAYFLDFHILCEDYVSISLKHLNKFKVDISAIQGMEIVKSSNKISDEFFEFYNTSRRLRNRLAHRYKMPKDEDLLLNLKNNLEYISELEQSIKDLLK